MLPCVLRATRKDTLCLWGIKGHLQPPHVSEAGRASTSHPPGLWPASTSLPRAQHQLPAGCEAVHSWRTPSLRAGSVSLHCHQRPQ